MAESCQISEVRRCESNKIDRKEEEGEGSDHTVLTLAGGNKVDCFSNKENKHLSILNINVMNWKESTRDILYKSFLLLIATLAVSMSLNKLVTEILWHHWFFIDMSQDLMLSKIKQWKFIHCYKTWLCMCIARCDR